MHLGWPSLGVLLLACTPAPVSSPWPADCPPQAPANALRLEPDSLPALAGHWQVVTVVLSPQAATPHWFRGHLQLWVSDSASRARRGIGLVPAGELTGSLQWEAAPRDSIPGDVTSLTLTLGERGGNDARVVEYRLQAHAGDRLWGFWEDRQTGIDRLANAAGDYIANPAGYFCAKRGA
jgi:hypothetical protein